MGTSARSGEGPTTPHTSHNPTNTPPPLTTHHTPHTTHHTPLPTAEPQPGVAGNRTPPQAAKPSQEWRGVAHSNLRQEWRGTNHTTHQPQPHQHTTAAHHTPQSRHHTPTQTPRAHAPRHKHTHRRRTTTRGGGDTHTSNTARNSEKPPPPPPPPPHPGETGHQPPQTAQRKGGRDEKGPRETQARDPTSGVWGPPR